MGVQRESSIIVRELTASPFARIYGSSPVRDSNAQIGVK